MIVVLVSADAEWLALTRALEPRDVRRSPYGEFFTDRVAARDVLFFHGGWGKIAAAASTEYAISTWQPRVLINVGTCGGIEGRVRLGDKLLVTRAVTYDIHEGMGDPEEAVRAYTVDVDVSWIHRPLPVPLRESTMASADRDLVPADVPDLVRRFDAVAADWESGAIAYVARRRGARLLIVRGVSDLVSATAAEAAGALPLFQTRAADVMRSLLGDLRLLVPHLAACGI